MNELTTAFEELAPLHSPIMVIALRGLFDVAEVATDAVDILAADRVAPIVASIDADPFFDFTQERPMVELDHAEIRRVRWPENEFRVAPAAACGSRVPLRPASASHGFASDPWRDAARGR